MEKTFYNCYSRSFTALDLPIWRGPMMTWMNILCSFSRLLMVWYVFLLYIFAFFFALSKITQSIE